MHTITKIPCGGVNCYIVEEGGGAILIDTPWASYHDKVLTVCEDKNIRLIVLTHGHMDHIQSAAALSKGLSAPIAMHRADYPLIRNNMEEPMRAHSLIGKIAVASIRMRLKRDRMDPFEPDVFLSDGDTLDGYGIRASIIGLPGHTKGSIGILVGGKDLFVGDALMNMLITGKPLLYGNRADMLKSAERIGGFASATLYFGHGKPVANRVC